MGATSANNRLQRTALRATAEPERWAAVSVRSRRSSCRRPRGTLTSAPRRLVSRSRGLSAPAVEAVVRASSPSPAPTSHGCFAGQVGARRALQTTEVVFHRRRVPLRGARLSFPCTRCTRRRRSGCAAFRYRELPELPLLTGASRARQANVEPARRSRLFPPPLPSRRKPIHGQSVSKASSRPTRRCS
jgi:hypothetical protein